MSDEAYRKHVEENIIAPTLDAEGVRIYEWNYDGKLEPRRSADINRDRGSLRRQRRMAAAREKGTHTKAEWAALADVFGQCVICGVPYRELNGGGPCRDHIRPVVLGGCDCIANIQPLCKNCNSSKTTDCTDYRPLARPDWQRAFLARLENGWE